MRILYFSHIRWLEIKQRPQFIAEGLAEKGHSVDYVCRVPFGKKGDRFFRLKPELVVKSIFVLPFSLKFPLIAWLNALFLRHTVNWRNYDLVIVTDPRLCDCLPKDLPAPVIYDCMDKASGFYSGKIREYIRRKERQLCSMVQGIIVSSFALRDLLAADYGVPEERIRVVKNAVSDDFIGKIDMEGARKLIGSRSFQIAYVGTIDFWFDWDPIADFARKNPDVRIALIGPVRCRTPELPENVVLFGTIPHDLVSAFLCFSRILILPFKRIELIDCVDPVKLYEYISLGKPVISSFWDELKGFQDKGDVHFYNTPEEFSQIASALLQKEDSSELNRSFAARNCWHVRVEEYNNMLLEISSR